tara:strand:+ start:312 stop:413 length:102 start_codon:yes stop_codon:yes gene_type:complete
MVKGAAMSVMKMIGVAESMARTMMAVPMTEQAH